MNFTNVSLKPHQIGHVERLHRILEQERVALDLSPMGLGKTYTTTECVVRLRAHHVVVVCPLTMRSKWEEVAREHGVQHVETHSFSAFRSKTGCHPKHGLLTKVPVVNGEGRVTETFRATDRLLALARDRTAFIVDEVHNLKNASQQFEACLEVCRTIYSEGGESGSVCVFLSGTPVDKEVHSINMLRLMGLLEGEKFFEYHGKNLLPGDSVRRLIERCRAIGPLKLSPSRTAGEGVAMLHNVFQTSVCSGWAGAMESPAEIIDLKDGYYDVEDNTADEICSVISEMNRMVRPSVGEGSSAFGAITRHLVELERLKIPTFERLVRSTLAEHPGSKVCVGLNYVERTLLGLLDRTRDLNPLFIVGDTPSRQRDDIIQKFQKEGSEHRLLIVNIRCVSTGIDLDDKTGSHPRFVFASPSYSIIELHQFSRRFARADTASTPVFRFVFAKARLNESSVLKSLRRKAVVVRGVLGTPEEQKYPGEYDKYME